MAAEPWRVPDSLWHELEPLIPKVERRFRYPGRKRHDDRACLEGILYVLRHGLPWRALPRLEGLPSGQTCWRRLDEWERAGVWAALLERLQQRSIEPRISRKRPRGQPPPPQARMIWRGRRRRAKTPDPLARERWPVERTNAWLHNWRRISTRWERRAELYLALLQLACSMIICRVLGWSL